MCEFILESFSMLWCLSPESFTLFLCLLVYFVVCLNLGSSVYLFCPTCLYVSLSVYIFVMSLSVSCFCVCDYVSQSQYCDSVYLSVSFCLSDSVFVSPFVSLGLSVSVSVSVPDTLCVSVSSSMSLCLIVVVCCCGC